MVGTLQQLKYLLLADIQTDSGQPRSGYATESNRNQLKVSIKELGIQSPISVIETGTGRYKIIDGHRRYLCAKDLKLQEIPCLVFDKLYEKQLDRIRYEIQNNRRSWRPLERATALESIRRTQKCSTIGDLAAYVHLSQTTVARILLLKEQNVSYLRLWEKYELSEAFQHALTGLLPKLQRVNDYEIEEVLVLILEKIKTGIIGNAKEISSLGSVFMRHSQNEPAINEFLEKPGMHIRELVRQTLVSGFSLHVEQVTLFINQKIAASKPFSPSETKSM